MMRNNYWVLDFIQHTQNCRIPSRHPHVWWCPLCSKICMHLLDPRRTKIEIQSCIFSVVIIKLFCCLPLPGYNTEFTGTRILKRTNAMRRGFSSQINLRQSNFQHQFPHGRTSTVASTHLPISINNVRATIALNIDRVLRQKMFWAEKVNTI